MCLGEIGRIVDRWNDGDIPMATVAVGPRVEQVCLLYEPDAAPEEHVLVHLGFVVERLDADRARAALRLRSYVPAEMSSTPASPATSRKRPPSLR